MGSTAQTRVAAFFDIDGTLVSKPSLERRFVAFLLWRRELRIVNGLRWVVEAIRLATRGAGLIRHGNKMHLRGVHARLHGAGGMRFVLPGFFPEALECAARHAAVGHHIVLTSGTILPLAKVVSFALEAQLSRLGCLSPVRVCATVLDESHGAWTGRILGEPMVGRAKAQAVLRLAHQYGYDLAASYAYADCASDRWLLGTVGHPAAANPTWRLARIARAKGWPVLRWSVAPGGDAPRQAKIRLAAMTVPRNFGKAL